MGKRLLMETTLEMLRKRKKGSSMCPSEVARAVRPQNWRPLMPAVREAARDLSLQVRISKDAIWRKLIAMKAELEAYWEHWDKYAQKLVWLKQD